MPRSKTNRGVKINEDRLAFLVQAGIAQRRLETESAVRNGWLPSELGAAQREIKHWISKPRHEGNMPAPIRILEPELGAWVTWYGEEPLAAVKGVL